MAAELPIRRALTIGALAVAGAIALYFVTPVLTEARLVASFLIHMSQGQLMPCGCTLCSGV